MDSWYSRVEKIKSYFHIEHLHGKPKNVGHLIEKTVNSKFLDEINKVNFGSDDSDHNKLRLYKLFNGSFNQEPYLTLVKNRNQRA